MIKAYRWDSRATCRRSLDKTCNSCSNRGCCVISYWIRALGRPIKRTVAIHGSRLDLPVVCQIEGLWKDLQAGFIGFNGTCEEPGRLCGISSSPFLAGLLKVDASCAELAPTHDLHTLLIWEIGINLLDSHRRTVGSKGLDGELKVRMGNCMSRRPTSGLRMCFFLFACRNCFFLGMLWGILVNSFENLARVSIMQVSLSSLPTL